MMFDVRKAIWRGLSAHLHVIVCEVNTEAVVVVASVFKDFFFTRALFFKTMCILIFNPVKTTIIFYDVLIYARVFAGRMQADHGTAEI